ncbi:DUF1349 domain-containing protein [Paenibacillus sp. UMB4589-SE434]|uniref:DUF1349 domain-containing protein n=1 Tax=Paenibacillus sp. UMB4589-SE434 TaxID=3046314 RepID=UPI0025514D0B|nr:DUF1349 domain-containing protein [Paenibacillus sp. UMB4589-SE434]MDK8183831.1 DUF1349 domain-containing protein [Paenibacillus sp. UMB4589-SE434]
MRKVSYVPEAVDQLKIWNEPPMWKVEGQDLLVRSAGESDFWLKTHYGFEVMNGHVFYDEYDTDFTAEVSLSINPESTYDQAGLFVMLSENCWLKTSLEYIPEGPSHLGAVVTNNGYSDWSTRNYPNDLNTERLAFRIERRNDDYTIYAATSQSDGKWEQLRIAHLHAEEPGKSVQIGLYCCSPTPNNGCETRFHSFTVECEN